MRFRQERKIQARQNDERHQEIDTHDNSQRQHGNANRHRGFAMTAVADLRGIEFARGRRPLPDDLIIGDRARGDISTTAIALTCPPSGGFGNGRATTSQIPA